MLNVLKDSHTKKHEFRPQLSKMDDQLNEVWEHFLWSQTSAFNVLSTEYESVVKGTWKGAMVCHHGC